ncbi:MAG TPA: hypothetical protein VGK41_09905 [Solirubrobacterales bacterium]
MESTVTTKPARGSVEHYTDLFRRTASDQHDLNSFVATLVEDVATAEIVLAVGKPVRTATDTERLERIRNIVAAGQLVRAELAAQ